MKKYETENKKAPSKAKEFLLKKLERDFNNFETQKESPNSSGDDKRQEKQISPSGQSKRKRLKAIISLMAWNQSTNLRIRSLKS